MSVSLETILERYPKEVTLADGTRVTLRPLRADDTEMLIELFQGISENDLRFLKDNVADPKVVRGWTANINYDRVLPIVAELDGRIVADATLHRKAIEPYADKGELRMFVHEEFRHQGLGQVLFEEIRDIARDLGLRKLMMEIFADEAGLIAMLQRRGFTREAVLPVYQTVVMALDLTPLPERMPPRELWPQRIYTLPEFAEYPEKLNLTEILLDSHLEAGNGDRVAVKFEDQQISYAELADQVNRIANGLRELGIREGDPVFMRTPNLPVLVACNFAAQKIGAVSLPTSPLFSRTEIAHVSNSAQAKAIIAHIALLEEVERARENLETVEHIVVVGGNPAELKERGYIPFAELTGNNAEVEPVRRDRKDLSVFLYTSGTTGPPKGTAHLMEDPLAVADAFGRYGWDVQPSDVIGGSAPIGFGAGYCTFAVIPFRFGASASLIAKFAPEAMFETIEKHRVTILSILPTAYRKMLQVPNAAERWDLSSLHTCTGGGESLTAKTYYDWKEAFGLEIFEGFGTTEMMYVFISNVVGRKAKPGSFGRVVPGYEAKVVNENFEEVAPGEIGHLVARGPTGTLYWNDQEKQRKTIWNGWNRVGDFVYRDEDGYFFFVSREDDIIKSSGYRIGPEEIEHALVKHPAVADAGVIGVPHPVRGQNAKAFVVLKEGQTATPEELLEFLREHIAVYKLPREFEFVDELPRTVTGKLLRRILREQERAKQEQG
ncbi:MAG: GNAT family N-acetyltransferase [Chloroflexi bacterium]|nr:MAG: GNAT family N-acetyltransferase [Chloroflexota bacterium]